MSQTTVNAGGQAIGVAGQLADSGDHDIVSGFNKDTSQFPFGFGARVQPGSAGDAYLLATGFSGLSPGLEVAGVNLYGLNHHRAGSLDAAGYQGDMGASGLLPNASMQVLRKGRVLVPVEIAVVAGDRAWCRGVATGSSGSAAWQGIWSGTGYNLVNDGAGSSYMIDCRRQGVFRTASYTAADGTTKVAVLEVDFTNRP